MSLSIQPAGGAFSIWGVIYLLLSIFVVYQALPDRFVPTRNNKVIFEEIKWVFSINMVINGLWLVVFMMGN